MILSFNGRLRGIGSIEDVAGIVLDYGFRDILPLFKGAPLAVFMCIALHSDDEGHSFLSYETIMRETGYGSKSTIADALRVLTEITVDGNKVLHQYRERDDAGNYTGSNHYRVFPDKDEPEVQSTVQSTETVPEVTTSNKQETKESLTVQKVDSGLYQHPAFLAFIESGGKVNRPRTKLKDGRTIKQRYAEVISKAVGDDPDDVAFWSRVVEAYIEQGWSSKSYTVMLEFYEAGAIPPNKRKAVRYVTPPPPPQHVAKQEREDALRRIANAQSRKESTND